MDPIANGVRIEITGLPDIVVPGGAMVDGIGWATNRRQTNWYYRDPSGSNGGITRIVIKDRSAVEDGDLRWSVRGRGGAVTLPPADQVVSTIVLGDDDELVTIGWNPPSAASPRCIGNAAALKCR